MLPIVVGVTVAVFESPEHPFALHAFTLYSYVYPIVTLLSVCVVVFDGKLLVNSVHVLDPDWRLYTENPVSSLELSVHVKLTIPEYVCELVAVSAVGVVGVEFPEPPPFPIVVGVIVTVFESPEHPFALHAFTLYSYV